MRKQLLIAHSLNAPPFSERTSTHYELVLAGQGGQQSK